MNRAVRFEINNKSDFFVVINCMFEAAQKEWDYDIIDYFCDMIPYVVDSTDDWRRIILALIPKISKTIEGDDTS